MRKITIIFYFAFFSGFIFIADNEVSIDQSGATFNLDVEQLGSGNLIGGTDAVAGTMTALDLDGATMTLDINQIGNCLKGIKGNTDGEYHFQNTQMNFCSQEYGQVFS